MHLVGGGLGHPAQASDGARSARVSRGRRFAGVEGATSLASTRLGVVKITPVCAAFTGLRFEGIAIGSRVRRSGPGLSKRWNEGAFAQRLSSRRVRDGRDGQLFFSCSKRSVVKTESDGRTSVGILALARLQPRAGRSNQGRSVRRCRLRREACAISCSFSRPAWPCRVGDGIIMRSAAHRGQTRRSRRCQFPDWSPLLQMIRGRELHNLILSPVSSRSSSRCTLNSFGHVK